MIFYREKLANLIPMLLSELNKNYDNHNLRENKNKILF